MKPLTTKQFIWFLVGSGLTVTLWLAFSNWVRNVAYVPICLSNLLSMSPEERRRPLGKWVALGVVLGFVVFAALSIASGVWQWFPKEPPKFLVNPAVILPLWLVCVWFAYRGWRVAKGQGETAVMEGDLGQPPVLSPVGTVATWEMIVAVLLITVAMILIFWVGIGLVSGPINH